MVIGAERYDEHAHIGLLDAGHGDRESLELATGELRHLALQDVEKLKLLAHVLLVIPLELRVEHLADGHLALDRAGYMIDVLRLDEGFQVVFEDLGEVVLQL